MGIPKAATRISAAEYLALEETAEFRSEFFDGEIFAMSGGTMNHSALIVEFTRLLGNALANSKCSLFDGNLKIKLAASNSYVYPDASVFCNNIQLAEGRKDLALNPTFILEVLSESTSAFDRGGKFHRYMTLPSLREYMLLEQKEAQADVFFKQANGKWELSSYFGLDAVVELQSLGVKIPLAEVYRRVVFDENEEPASPTT